MRSKQHARQLATYGLVGAVNTLVSALVFTFLVDARLPAPLAAGAAFAVGAANGYWWNRRWTFTAPRSLRGAIRYVVVQLCGLGATSALLWLLTASAGVNDVAAYLPTFAVVTCVTFVANRRWTFAVVTDAG